jgi:hypothetical protein
MDLETFMDGRLDTHFLARDNIFMNRHIVDDYIADIEAKLGHSIESDRALLLQAIKNARYTDFIVVNMDASVYFIDYHRNNAIYEITGLTQEPVELYTTFPCLVKTALIQYGERIVSDGLNHFNKSKYPKKAAGMIMKDFENELATNLKTKVAC